jgi:hypothetical protein
VFQLTRLTVNFSPDQKIKFRPTPKHKFKLFSRNIKHITVFAAIAKLRAGPLCAEALWMQEIKTSVILSLHVFAFAMYLRALKILFNKNLIYLFIHLFIYIFIMTFQWYIDLIDDHELVQKLELNILHTVVIIGEKHFTSCKNRIFLPINTN